MKRDKIGWGVFATTGRPITVPTPTDYSERIEAAREHLRSVGRTGSIEPPQEEVLVAQIQAGLPPQWKLQLAKAPRD